MKNSLQYIEQWLLSFLKPVPLVVLISLLLLSYCILEERFPHSNGDVRALFPRSSPALSEFKETNRVFGNYVNDVILVHTGNKLSLDKQEQLLELEDELLGLDGVEDVISPLGAFSTKIKSPLPLRSSLKDTARFIVKIDGSLDDSKRAILNSKINELLSRFPKLLGSRAGPFFISESVTNAIEQETRVRTPLTLVSLLLTGTLLLRSTRLALLVLLAPALSVVWVLLIAGVFGISLGPVSQLVPPFILAIAASYSIHVATRLSGVAENAREHVQNELRTSIAVAATTTIIGMLSFYVIDVQGVQEFALLAAFGVLISAFLALFLTPHFVTRTSAIMVSLPQWLFSLRGNLSVSLIIIGISLFAGFGIPRLQIHTEPMMFLPEGSPEHSSITKTSESFPGNRLLSVMFRSSSSKLSLEDLEFIASVSRKISALPQVYSTISDRDFQELKDIREEFSLLDSNRYSWAPQDITSEDLSASRILFETNLEGALLLQLSQDVRELVTTQIELASLQDRLIVSVSGLELLVAAQTNTIVKGIIRSLLFTLVVVSVILLTAFRDPVLLLIALVPNITPIMTILGMIGWIYRDINLGASLVGAAALSIAVDNTFHFMFTWSNHRGVSARAPSSSAVAFAASQCFPSFVSTSIVLTSGFGVMAVSDVLPVQQFGLLLALTLLIGLIADTVLLPHLLSSYESRQQTR